MKIMTYNSEKQTMNPFYSESFQNLNNIQKKSEFESDSKAQTKTLPNRTKIVPCIFATKFKKLGLNPYMKSLEHTDMIYQSCVIKKNKSKSNEERKYKSFKMVENPKDKIKKKGILKREKNKNKKNDQENKKKEIQFQFKNPSKKSTNEMENSESKKHSDVNKSQRTDAFGNPIIDGKKHHCVVIKNSVETFLVECWKKETKLMNYETPKCPINMVKSSIISAPPKPQEPTFNFSFSDFSNSISFMIC
jgi:hypothetical protein